MSADLPARIREARKRAGLSQVELATTLGTAQSQVSAWERGHETPSTPYVVALATVLRVSTDWLLGV